VCNRFWRGISGILRGFCGLVCRLCGFGFYSLGWVVYFSCISWLCVFGFAMLFGWCSLWVWVLFYNGLWCVNDVFFCGFWDSRKIGFLMPCVLAVFVLVCCMLCYKCLFLGILVVVFIVWFSLGLFVGLYCVAVYFAGCLCC